MNSKKVSWWATLFLAEFFASAFLLFIVCLGCVDNSPFFKPTHATISIAVGVAVMIGFNTFNVISGGYMSPIITLSAYIFKILDLPTALIYAAGQISGSFFGYSVLRFAVPNEYLSSPGEFCMTQPSLTPGSTFLVEFVISFIFIIFICAMFDPRNSTKQDSSSIKFGLLIGGIVLIAGPYSGASMNPARSLAPAIFNRNFKNQWIYIVSPLCASLVASLLFKKIFSKNFSLPTEKEMETNRIKNEEESQIMLPR